MKLLSILLLVLLVGCGKHRDGTSVWAEGLWILPLLTGLGALWFSYVTYRASKSNSTTQLPGQVVNNTGNVPFYKVPQFKFVVILLLATAAIIIGVNWEK